MDQKAKNQVTTQNIVRGNQALITNDCITL